MVQTLFSFRFQSVSIAEFTSVFFKDFHTLSEGSLNNFVYVTLRIGEKVC